VTPPSHALESRSRQSAQHYAAIVPTLRRDAADAMDRALKSNRA
jgi:hypothetical protein